MKSKLLFFLFFIGFVKLSIGQKPIVFKGVKQLVISQTLFLVDTNRNLSVEDVKSKIDSGLGFSGKLDLDYLNYPIWIKLVIENNSNEPTLMAVFENPLIDSIDFFSCFNDTIFYSFHNYLGEGFNSRKHRGTFQKFELIVPKNQKCSFMFKVRSTEQLLLPLTLSTETEAIQNNNQRDLIYGAFMGVVLVMLFYNLFVYFSTRDKNYLYYVVYIFFIGLGQIALSGHLFSLVLGDLPTYYKVGIVFFPALSGIFAILFIKQFLQAKLFAPQINKGLNIIALAYGLAAIMRILGYTHYSARMMDMVGLPGAFLVFILAFKVYKKGNKSAGYFIVAWSIFIIGVVLFVMRNFGFITFNGFTTYTLPFGASIEVALLSFALANKINTLQEENREKEKEALMAALLNEKLIKEQNVILEQKVLERTVDLERTNNQLSSTLHDLKSTQSQLVEQEKMASLGQLTAGIAHEINNPINFVTSNINPLKRDIKMVQELLSRIESLSINGSKEGNASDIIQSWKQEIDYDYLNEEISYLLKGIDDGAHRTAEIVKGLKIFARNDEDTILNADLVEGIESTLVILNNQFGKILIQKNYQGPIFADCYPGKLNQVFLNLISNALFAIHAKFGDERGGEITINLTCDSDYIYLSFGDNGIGMDEETQKKVFEPFYTTKPVGQGTGLGLSIVFKTIESHKGKITLTSELGVGTCFKIQLSRTLIFQSK